MSKPVIPEDLAASYAHYQKLDKLNAVSAIHPTVILSLIERIGRVEQERDKLSRGGCGKPGHTTCSGEEGTCYCLTCELEGQLAKVKRERDETKAQLAEMQFKYTQPKGASNGR
jgi:hypothetical protein